MSLWSGGAGRLRSKRLSAARLLVAYGRLLPSSRASRLWAGPVVRRRLRTAPWREGRQFEVQAP